MALKWPWSNQGIASASRNVPQNMQQYFSGTDWRSQMQPMNAGWSNTNQAPVDYSNYEDLIQNPENMPNALQNLEMFSPVDDPDRLSGGYDEADSIKYMRREDEPYFAENFTARDLLDPSTTMGGYLKHPSGPEWGSQEDKDKYLRSQSQGTKKGFDFSKLANFLPGRMLRGIMSNFRDSPQEAFNREYFPTAEIGGSQRVNYNPAEHVFGNKNVSYAFGPGLEVGAQKRIDTLQRTIDKMEDDESWTQLKKKNKPEWDAKLARLKAKRLLFIGQKKKYVSGLAADTAQASQVSAPVSQGAATTGGGGDVSRSRGDHQAPAFREAPKSWDVSSGMGPGGRHYAYGGRAGYQGGELVGQETDFIQGPQGGEEFQETVVEGQEQPSQEQLEALAMEIFQLPLEELDEQQLLVVYQAAMQGQPMEEDFQENVQFADQGQPMEEAVQEEDIQFAANGGLASLL